MQDETNQQRSFLDERREGYAPGTTRRNRRIVVPRYGGPEVMTVIEEPLPEPGSGEVRVRILAVPEYVGLARSSSPAILRVRSDGAAPQRLIHLRSGNQ